MEPLHRIGVLLGDRRDDDAAQAVLAHGLQDLMLSLIHIWCLKAFNELGLRVGADIALVGFDDIDALCWLDYNISVVSRDVPEMGKQAMRCLLYTSVR